MPKDDLVYVGHMLDKAQESGRLHGLLHGGQWHHFTTPADVAAVNNMLVVRREHEARIQALLAQKKNRDA